MDAPDTETLEQPAEGHPTEGREVHLGQQDLRAAKLAARRAAGETEPYRWPVDRSCADVRAVHGGLPPDTVTDDEVHLAGRLTGLRRQEPDDPWARPAG